MHNEDERNRDLLVSALRSGLFPVPAGSVATEAMMIGHRWLAPSNSRPGLDHIVEYKITWWGTSHTRCSCEWGADPEHSITLPCRHALLVAFFELPEATRTELLIQDRGLARAYEEGQARLAQREAAWQNWLLKWEEEQELIYLYGGE